MGPMTISLIGLPGSGKTTLCRPLATEFRYQGFVLGDALRQRAAVDTELQEMLSRGDLAPEAVVLELVKNAVIATRNTGLVLDGFPRHVNQIGFAKAHFAGWVVLHLDVNTETAMSRLQDRFICGTCGRIRFSASEDQCPSCARSTWVKRSEDAPDILRHRLESFKVLLHTMLDELRDVAIYRIDATRSSSEVLGETIQLVRRVCQ